MKKKLSLAVFFLFFILIFFSSYATEDIDFELIIQDKNLKTELKKLDGSNSSEIVKLMGKTVGWIKDLAGFCDELDDSLAVNIIKKIDSIPVQKLQNNGLVPYYKIQHVRTIVNQRSRNSFSFLFKSYGQELSGALCLYSLYSDVSAALAGDNISKIKAIWSSYQMAQWYIQSKLNMSICSSITGFVVPIIGFYLNVFIETVMGEKEDLLFRSYMSYMEKKYPNKYWREIIDKAYGESEDGEKPVENLKQIIHLKLYEYWNTFYMEDTDTQAKYHRIYGRVAHVREEIKNKIAAYYFKNFLWKTIKDRLERNIAWKAYQKEKELKRILAELKKLEQEKKTILEVYNALNRLEDNEETTPDKIRQEIYDDSTQMDNMYCAWYVDNAALKPVRVGHCSNLKDKRKRVIAGGGLEPKVPDRRLLAGPCKTREQAIKIACGNFSDIRRPPPHSTWHVAWLGNIGKTIHNISALGGCGKK